MTQDLWKNHARLHRLCDVRLLPEAMCQGKWIYYFKRKRNFVTVRHFFFSSSFLLLRFLREQRRAAVYTNLITHVAYCINKIIYNLHCKCNAQCVNVNEIGRDGSKYKNLFSSISIQMRAAWIYTCGSDAFMPTDLNINLLRRHVILSTYFVHTIAIVTQHAAAAVMRKNIIKCVVRYGVYIVSPKCQETGHESERKNKNICMLRSGGNVWGHRPRKKEFSVLEKFDELNPIKINRLLWTNILHVLAKRHKVKIYIYILCSRTHPHPTLLHLDMCNRNPIDGRCV